MNSSYSVVCLNFNLQNPIEGVSEIMAGTLCCQSGPITGHISVSKRGYVPAQNIPFAVSLQNKSKRKLSSVRVTLTQVRNMNALDWYQDFSNTNLCALQTFTSNCLTLKCV